MLFSDVRSYQWPRVCKKMVIESGRGTSRGTDSDDFGDSSRRLRSNAMADHYDNTAGANSWANVTLYKSNSFENRSKGTSR